jgi:hypothetical protein
MNKGRSAKKKSKEVKTKLRSLTSWGKLKIIECLELKDEITRHELEPYVISRMTSRTNLICSICFIRAYKDLEAEGKIVIKRGSTPFPMTDFETVFALGGEKQN